MNDPPREWCHIRDLALALSLTGLALSNESSQTHVGNEKHLLFLQLCIASILDAMSTL